jgi:nucleotide-binding universal stress UspA family protein
MTKQGFARILLATDGSPEATAAAGAARSFAHASGARVRVVHVWNMEVHHRGGVWDVETRSEAERLINDAIAGIRATGIEADGEIIRSEKNHVASAIAKAAKDFGADLVVLGSRGLSEWQSMLKHGTSHQLLSSVDCPVLMVRSNCSAATHDAQRVLLAVAGGDDVPTAVRATIAAAAAPGSEVMVTHVQQSYMGMPTFAYIEPEEDVQATLNRAVAGLNAAGINPQILAAHAGPVAQSLAEIAANWKADVIVLGSGRMGDLEGLLVGSVTHELLRTTEKPILVAERAKA